jgi:hypothetical protein
MSSANKARTPQDNTVQVQPLSSSTAGPTVTMANGDDPFPPTAARTAATAAAATESPDMDSEDMSVSSTTALPDITGAMSAQEQHQQQFKAAMSYRHSTTTTAATATATAASLKSTTTQSSNAATIVTKKRPYRRTKRPKNYCDKSTISTVTTVREGANGHGHDHVATAADFALSSSVNVYDAVLAESKDLLTAAIEAQQLGRLKMAAAYQLLLHARLVGLGKRFDKAIVSDKAIASDTVAGTVDNANGTVDMNMDATLAVDDGAAAVALTPGPQLQTPVPVPTTPGAAVSAAHASTSTSTITTRENIPGSSSSPYPPPPTPRTAAARQLARLLPPTCELDQTMMEHLAKAAAELHAQRSGRKRQLAVAVAGYDMDQVQTPDQFFAQTANQLQVPNAANVYVNPGIAWSGQDVKQLTAAQAANKSVKEIAALVHKSEQQVKAFIRNQTARIKVEADLELLPDVASSSAGGGGPGDSAGADSAGGATGNASAKKRGGGRGRKPATTAISTVPNAVCDARTLLQGKGIPKLTK